MTVRCFVDSNVLVYADDRSAGSKRDRARELIREVLGTRSGVLSLQVLQEYFAVVRRKLGISATAARRRIEVLQRLEVVVLEVQDLMAAIELHRLHAFSIWDSLVIRAALECWLRDPLQRGSPAWSSD